MTEATAVEKARSPRGQRKTQDPCPGCHLHKRLCICEFIPTLILKTKICLVIHAKELKRTTNTGTLALRALPNSQMFVRGETLQPLDLRSVLDGRYETFLFYPSEEAEELTTEFLRPYAKPIQLIVPDGNWRQASKVHHRHPELHHLKRVMIKKPNRAENHLRAETRTEGMSTLEAIAEAMGIIEGAHARQTLLELYQRKLRATLIGRGLVKTGDTEVSNMGSTAHS